MTTQHFHDFKEFEAFASKQPVRTLFFVHKVSPEGLDVLITPPGETMTVVQHAEAFAQVALGDPSMKCVATGVTEFGSITGTCVPRFP